MLDIMVPSPQDFRSITGEPQRVPSARVGLEILRRVRAGHYGQEPKQAAVFIRSGRGELHTKVRAKELGADGFFSAGVDDDALVKKIVSIAAEDAAKEPDA